MCYNQGYTESDTQGQGDATNDNILDIAHGGFTWRTQRKCLTERLNEMIVVGLPTML